MKLHRRNLPFLSLAWLTACTPHARARPPADLPGAWLDFAAKLAADLPPETPRSPALELAPSRLCLAMFEAANAIRPRYASYLNIPRAPGISAPLAGVPGAGVPGARGAGAPNAANHAANPATPPGAPPGANPAAIPGASPAAGAASLDPDEAVSAAAHAILRATYPAAWDRIDAFYTQQSAATPDSLNKLRATVVGEHAAGIILARPALDPAVPITPYRPPTTPGRFVPPALPDTPDFLAALRPWFLPNAAALRPPPPPAITSPDFAAAYAQVASLGARASTTRSPGQTEAARFWSAYSWDDALHGAAHLQSSLVDTTRLYALSAMVLLDTRIAVAEAQSAYLAWRPVTAIRNGDQTGNPATPRIPGWEPLVPTPTDPGYPSAAAALAAALAGILAAASGHTADTRYSFHSRAGLGTRSLTLAQFGAIVPASRIWAGTEFGFSVSAGTRLGAAVARAALARNEG